MLCPPASLDELEFKVTVEFGHLELVQVQEMRGERLYMGGYTIARDPQGVEISRTPTEWYGYATYA